jgi:hypothetical protein
MGDDATCKPVSQQARLGDATEQLRMQYHRHDASTQCRLTWQTKCLRTLSTNIDLVRHTPDLRRVGHGFGAALGTAEDQPVHSRAG